MLHDRFSFVIADLVKQADDLLAKFRNFRQFVRLWRRIVYRFGKWRLVTRVTPALVDRGIAHRAKHEGLQVADV